MKHTLWMAMAITLVSLTNIQAAGLASFETKIPLASADPVTIVNKNASDQARDNAHVNFVNSMYDFTGTTTKREQTGTIDSFVGYYPNGEARWITYPVYNNVTYYEYDPATQKVFNSGKANNDNVIGAQATGAPTLYVK